MGLYHLSVIHHSLLSLSRVFSRLHHHLRLSHPAQTNRHVDLTPLSPTYVYSGQHCPIAVRLTEAVWAASQLPTSSQHSPPFTNSFGDSASSFARTKASSEVDDEIVTRSHLNQAIKSLGLGSDGKKHHHTPIHSLCFLSRSMLVSRYGQDT